MVEESDVRMVSSDQLILQQGPGIVSKITAFASKHKIATGIGVLIFVIIIAKAFHGGKKKKRAYGRRHYHKKTRTSYYYV